jgi:hypothetical protein
VASFALDAGVAAAGVVAVVPCGAGAAVPVAGDDGLVEPDEPEVPPPCVAGGAAAVDVVVTTVVGGLDDVVFGGVVVGIDTVAGHTCGADAVSDGTQPDWSATSFAAARV